MRLVMAFLIYAIHLHSAVEIAVVGNESPRLVTKDRHLDHAHIGKVPVLCSPFLRLSSIRSIGRVELNLVSNCRRKH